MAKWTKGPWVVVRDEFCEAPWNFDVCAEAPTGDRTLVARVRIVPPHGDVEANAKLIAKSPELAELLRAWFECYLHGTATDKTRLAEKTEKLLHEIGAGD